VPWLKRLDARLSPGRPWCNPRVVCETFVVDEVALGQCFLLAQCTLDYPVCGLSRTIVKLLMTKDGGGN
jgi:hypothetical protein